jgi:Tectonin domain
LGIGPAASPAYSPALPTNGLRFAQFPTMLLRRQFVQSSALGLIALGLHVPASANAGARWVRVPGKATDIANGQAWILGDKRTDGGKEIFRRDKNQWTQVPGGAAKIAVDPKGLPWVINTEGLIFQWVEPGGWTRQGKEGADIAIGADGSVYCLTKPGVDQNGGVYVFGAGQWKSANGRGVTLAVDPKGQAWVTTNKNEILRLDAGAWKTFAGTASQIAIGGSGAVWALGFERDKSGNAGVQLLGKGDAWTKVPGAAARIAVDPKGLAWVVNASGEIYQRA